jgi:hypothetical protein
METNIIQETPFYIKGIINGLAGTISLWIFWTPFIIFLARPLINAQLKEVVCNGLSYIALNYESNFIDAWNNALWHYLYSLVQTGKIDMQQYDELVEKYSIPWIITGEPIPPEIQSILDENPQKNWNDNLSLITIFAITFVCVIIGCLVSIVLLSQIYGVNLYNILIFNLIMTVIVVCIEATFFGTVTMRYNPYDLNLIVQELESNILNMF